MSKTRVVMSNPNIKENLDKILQCMSDACVLRPKELSSQKPRLVAVSKTKPSALVIEAYNHGQRHFGENYVQEFSSKAWESEVQEQCPDVKWHFIGRLQKSGLNKILNAPHLYMIETIDSLSIAQKANASLTRIGREEPLRCFIQVNTSGEENKGGVEPSAVNALVSSMIKDLPKLKFSGLMTIGSLAHSKSSTEEANPDFETLCACRAALCAELDIPVEDVELSMGMSTDYQRAIEMGSTSVRVGSAIFGSRS